MIRLVAIGYRLAAEERTIAIRDCVHYCGFRYGRGEINPYEQYAHALLAGVPEAERRGAFLDFLQHYRPQTLGEALGVRLSLDYPLWQLPWSTGWRRKPAWVSYPHQVVDVMTHFCERGIPAALVESEFSWHERALASMASQGYRPGFARHARVRVLQGPTHTTYLVTDGNHRISALSALGVETLPALSLRGATVRRDRARWWPQVRRGQMNLADALAVFDAYQRGQPAPPRAPYPVPLV